MTSCGIGHRSVVLVAPSESSRSLRDGVPASVSRIPPSEAPGPRMSISRPYIIYGRFHATLNRALRRVSQRAGFKVVSPPCAEMRVGPTCQPLLIARSLICGGLRNSQRPVLTVTGPRPIMQPLPFPAVVSPNRVSKGMTMTLIGKAPARPCDRRAACGRQSLAHLSRKVTH